MYKVKEAIIVEGNYDKIRLSNFIDGVIITTHGFAVFSNDDFIKTIQHLSEKTGIVILTDSDSAGLKIRNFIKQKAANGVVKHAYVPDIMGKERRKQKASKEGLLGVEGMSDEIIIKALRDAGCEIDDTVSKTKESNITKADMYALGLSGKADSQAMRQSLARELSIPAKLSANMLLDVLNKLLTYDELVTIIQKINQEL